MDYEAIRRRGIERGLLSSDQAPSREELAQLIFQPGFSTRDTASQVAGRGVGMDVVASTLEKARGWLEVKSETGQGTTIRLSFPLPSVIQHAMVFRYANQSFAIPMESVRSVGDVNPNIPRAPFFGLQGLSSPTTEMTQAIVLNNDQHGHGNPVAIYVEEIVGPEELVVRPLPRLLRDHPFCMGVTLSGSGQAVLLLDARRVLKRHIHATPATNLQQRPQPIHQIQRPPRVLVVDDSLSARKRVVRSLTRFPLDIVEATNGKEAMALVQTETFAAIFSDMEMPHLDGFGLLERIGKSAPDSPPIVIISSRSEDEFVVRARELGAADYLIKPLDDSHLDNTLKRLTPLQHLVGDFQPQQGRD